MRCTYRRPRRPAVITARCCSRSPALRSLSAQRRHYAGRDDPRKGAAGVPWAEVLSRQGIMPGIKVDTGARPLAGCPGETVTEGLDWLRDRLAEYRDLGARFAKWRAGIPIGGGMPSVARRSGKGHPPPRYTALLQGQGMVASV